MNEEKSIERSDFLRQLIRQRPIFLGILTIIIVVFASIIFKPFATILNLKSFLLNISTNMIVAIGMMILLISGAFDLSVGSVAGLTGALSANLMYYGGINWIVSVVTAFLLAVGIGLLNGVLIAKVGVNPLIETLAMMGLIRGFALQVGGTGIIGLPDGFLKIADNKFIGIRTPIWYMICIVVIFTFLVSKTLFFSRYYYIGSNEKAANLSGINVVKMRIISFMIASGLAGIGGIILTSRLQTALASLGNGLELRVITACILGGASLSGGQGSIYGAIMGTIFIAVLNNIMIIARISSFWQMIVTGTILLIAVTLDAVINRPRAE
jgi:ribose/xylose/arabinose/galactoside ABC-type transport system permease subunit